MWANTVLASGKAIALIIYTGKETRMSMNSREARNKIGSLDEEVNFMAKLLFLFMIIFSAGIVFLKGFNEGWVMTFFRFVLLLSTIIPISLKVNVDIAKSVFSYLINTDEEIPETVARN